MTVFSKRANPLRSLFFWLDWLATYLYNSAIYNKKLQINTIIEIRTAHSKPCQSWILSHENCKYRRLSDPDRSLILIFTLLSSYSESSCLLVSSAALVVSAFKSSVISAFFKLMKWISLWSFVFTLINEIVRNKFKGVSFFENSFYFVPSPRPPQPEVKYVCAEEKHFKVIVCWTGGNK